MEYQNIYRFDRRTDCYDNPVATLLECTADAFECIERFPDAEYLYTAVVDEDGEEIGQISLLGDKGERIERALSDYVREANDNAAWDEQHRDSLSRRAA
jgi:hypothetical protein